MCEKERDGRGRQRMRRESRVIKDVWQKDREGERKVCQCKNARQRVVVRQCQCELENILQTTRV